MGDAARVLGIPFEEMMERMDETEDIRELQAERGLTIEQFIAALYDVVRGRLEERVSRGELSEEEAGHILAELKHRLFQDLAGVGPVSPTLFLLNLSPRISSLGPRIYPSTWDR